MSKVRIVRHNHVSYEFADGPVSWTDVDVTDVIPKEIRGKIRAIQADAKAVQGYLAAIYQPLRQSGGIDVSHVEVPLCVAGLKDKSEQPSPKRASRTSTKRKATSSGSPSSEDTDASTAPAKQ